MTEQKFRHLMVTFGFGIAFAGAVSAVALGLFRPYFWFGALMAAAAVFGAFATVSVSARHDDVSVFDHPVVAVFRLLWAAALVLMIGAGAVVLQEMVGEWRLTAAYAAATSWSAQSCGWPRFAMPPPKHSRPWWNPKRYVSLLRIFSFICLMAEFGAVAALAEVRRMYRPELPTSLATLTQYEPMRATRVLSAEGQVIGEFFIEKRIIVPYEKIPEHVRNAFVAAEDQRFFRHHGIDPIGILRAALENLKARRVVQGGSTITQQVAKQLLTGSERSLERKVKEALLAREVERRLAKGKILEIYLNHVYLGHGAYGVEAAAEIYFAKSVADLTLAQAAMIAGLMTAPSHHSPFDHYDKAKLRQTYVLDRMLENGVITESENEAARHEQIGIVSKDIPIKDKAAPYFVEFVRKYLVKTYGGKGLFLHGLTVWTTLSLKHQRIAQAALRFGLDELDLNLGFRGPVEHLEGEKAEKFCESPPSPYLPGRPAVPVALDAQPGRAYYAMVSGRKNGAVKVMIGKSEFALAGVDVRRVAAWEARQNARLKTGDVVTVRLKSDEKRESRAYLTQLPKVQAAFIAVDPHDGRLLAMVGGYDYGINQFNRATQAKRQAGSSIKPFVYAAAIQDWHDPETGERLLRGLTETDEIMDAPYSKRTASGLWEVENYDKTYAGSVTLRTALAKSLNTVSCRLVDHVGVDRVIATMRKLGIETEIPRNTSIAVGTPDVRLIDMAYAYATFPAGGREIKPRYIDKIIDASGRVIADNTAERPSRRRIDPQTAYIMVDLMKGVVENGTARRVRALGRPAAGKTGTSTDFRDAWFIGFTTDVLAGVWIGRDDFTPIGDKMTGGSAALPIWMEYMRRAHPDTLPRDFPAPTGVVFVRGDPRSGKAATAGETALIPYRRGTEPAAGGASDTADAFASPAF